jgi:hypothetical protein
MGVVSLSVISVLARQIYLESSVQIGCVVPRLCRMTRLSPGDDMIPEEGIMVCVVDIMLLHI